MKRLKLAALIILITIFSALQLTSANTGSPPLGQTNAPGEQNCSSCHNTFGLNVGNGRILLLGAPREYKPGETYSIQVTIEDPLASSWGFEVTAINDKGDRAGTFTVLDANHTNLLSNNQRNYLLNTISGNYAGSTSSAN